MPERLNATVKWFNDEKRYGFITRDDGVDLFVHSTAIETTGFGGLKEGQNVTYELVPGPKGDHVDKVRVEE
jgi:CspA family cold shock protein